MRTDTNLALARLQAINKRGNRAHVVGHGEQDQLFVHKLAVTNGVGVVVQESAWLELTEPLLTRVDLLLAESQVNALVVLLIDVLEWNLVSVHLGKVLLGFLSSAGTQSCEKRYTIQFTEIEMQVETSAKVDAIKQTFKQSVYLNDMSTATSRITDLCSTSPSSLCRHCFP